MIFYDCDWYSANGLSRMRKVPRKCDLNLATDAHAWFDESKQNLGIVGYSNPDDETLPNSFLN